MGRKRAKRHKRQEITDYLTWLKAKGRSERTCIFYTRRVEDLEDWLAARNVDLMDAGPEDLEEWREQLDMLDNSVITYVAAIRVFYRWAFRSGRIAADPSWDIPVPRKRRGLPRPIPEDELERAVKLAPARIRPWLVLAGYAGLRCCEIAWAQRDDVHDQADEPFMFVRGKGGSIDAIELSPYVLAELRAAGLPKTGPLFPRADGKRGHLTPHLISSVGNTYLHSIGIEATMHQLRHRFGTRTYAAVKDLRVVQELLRHRNSSSTAIYTATSRPTARAAVTAVQPSGWKKRGAILRSITPTDQGQ